MGSGSMGAEEDYSSLKDVRLEIKGEDDGAFVLCFWLYLSNSTPFPSVILRQTSSEITCSIPFLGLDEKKRMMLLPLPFLHKEAPSPGSATPWTEIPHASTNIVFPAGKWVHVGCEVGSDFVRLHIDGEISGEKHLTSSSGNNSDSDGLKKLSLVGTDGDDDAFQGYVHGLRVLPKPSSVNDHFVKDPPLQLSIDGSSSNEIEEDNDGVWSVSCLWNFSLDVILLDAFGEPVNREMEVTASLLYADNGATVEKSSDAESPLLTCYGGIEFACNDRPSELVNGRASFNLKISQLSSRLDNRLFRIRFDIPKMGRYPFFEAFCGPIRCISRDRFTRAPLVRKKSNSDILLRSGSSPSVGLDDGTSELRCKIVHEAKLSSSSKRVKFGQGHSFTTSKADLILHSADVECNASSWTANEDDNAYGTSLERRSQNPEETDNSPSDSDSNEARNSVFKSISGNRSQLSDLTTFKYCLGGLTERALLLKEIATAVSLKELANFAQNVSLYLGCPHHGHQIIVAKTLVEEGTKAWSRISQNNTHVLWENAVSKINQCFMKIVYCSSRSLSQQDLELLRRISGCQELIGRENFEKLWCWLYPVAFTLSRDWVNSVWNSTSPKWIEGFITKEEAESSLQGEGGFQEPGTFVLRFPTSRSWPHPDAGNLVVTYVGSDYKIHHRLLSLEFILSSGEKEMTSTTLQKMLLAAPELSQLGRITRSF